MNHFPLILSKEEIIEFFCWIKKIKWNEYNITLIKEWINNIPKIYGFNITASEKVKNLIIIFHIKGNILILNQKFFFFFNFL